MDAWRLGARAGPGPALPLETMLRDLLPTLEGDGPDATVVGPEMDVRYEPGEQEDGADEVEEARPKARGVNHANWQAEKIPIRMPVFDKTNCGLQIGTLTSTSSPFAVFRIWWTRIRALLVVQTNIYAHVLCIREPGLAYMDGYRAVTENEMDRFLAVIICMGLCKKQNEDWYWRDDHLGDSFIKSLMSRDRFSVIKRCLSVANPTQDENDRDKLAKVRAIVDVYNDISAAAYMPGQFISLDEAQIQCASRFARCSHRGEKHKPLSDYIKVFSINESGTCYCPRVLIDERTKVPLRQYVMDLVEPLVRWKRPYIVVTDRFYTSVSMAGELLAKGVYTVGTIRTDRGVPKDLVAESSRLKDGEWKWRMAASAQPDSSLSVVVWHDTTDKGVYFLSNVHDPEQPAEVERRKKGAPAVTKSAPQVAADYNKHMGAVDAINHMKHSFKTQLRYKHRWYMGVVFYIIDISIINALVCFRQLCNSDVDQGRFRIDLMNELARPAEVSVKTPTKRKRVDVKSPVAPSALLPGPHLIRRIGGDHPVSCAQCTKVGKPRKRTLYDCVTCDHFLHPDCFLEWHGYE